MVPNKGGVELSKFDSLISPITSAVQFDEQTKS
jgi:hypothetical protein